MNLFKHLFLTLATVFFALSLLSCSNHNDDDTSSNQQTFWTVDGKTYEASVARTQDYYNDDRSVVIMIVSKYNENEVSDNSTIMVSIENEEGEGEYPIAAIFSETSKYVNISCGVGEKMYELPEENTNTTVKAKVTIDKKGNYHVNILEPISLREVNFTSDEDKVLETVVLTATDIW